MKFFILFSIINILISSAFAQEVEEIIVSKPKSKPIEITPPLDLNLDKKIQIPDTLIQDTIKPKIIQDSVVKILAPLHPIQIGPLTPVNQINTFSPNPQISNSKPKSLGLALLGSFLFPGSGEYYLGQHNRGRLFMWTEITLISSAWISGSLKNSTLKSARTYAVQHAKASQSKLDEDVLQKMAEYRSSWGVEGLNVSPNLTDDYLQSQIRSGVSPEKLFAQTNSNYWDWGTSEDPQNDIHFARYQSLMGSYRTAKIFWQASFGLMILNRVLSMADVIHLHKKQQNFQITPQVNPFEKQLSLSLDYQF